MNARKRATALMQENPVGFVLLAVVVALLITTPQFGRVSNLTNVLEQTALLGIIAVGVGLLLVSGNFDLSVGGQVALNGIVISKVANEAGLGAALAAGVVVGAALGLANGVLVVVFKINSLMATLGTGSVLSGCALLVSDTAPVLLIEYSLPDLVASKFLGIATPFWVYVAVIAVASWYLHITIAGRETYAVGANPEAARFAGVRVATVRMIPFVLVGVCTGLAALMLVGQVAAGLPDAATTWPLQVITAVVLGGISIRGGRGTIAMAVIGTLLIGVAKNGFNLLGLPGALQQIFIGSILVVALGLDEAVRRIQASRERRALQDDDESTSGETEARPRSVPPVR